MHLATKEEMAAWLQGFYDGEGNVDPRGRTIRLTNTSKMLIEKTCQYLNALNICYSLEPERRPNPLWKPRTTIHIRGVINIARFKVLVGFTEPRKQERLKQYLDNLSLRTCKTILQNDLTREIVEEKYLTQQMSLRDIGKEWGINHQTVRRLLYRFGIPARDRARSIAIKKSLQARRVLSEANI